MIGDREDGESDPWSPISSIIDIAALAFEIVGARFTISAASSTLIIATDLGRGGCNADLVTKPGASTTIVVVTAVAGGAGNTGTGGIAFTGTPSMLDAGPRGIPAGGSIPAAIGIAFEEAPLQPS